ncbi:PTS galactitol transporter subunit IIC [Listeria monocytogenes]|uniref:PTS galactitol transporter subunit IIC n=1 Tax=Enterococcus TaxID=1350 RepID=UPI0009BE57E2|nr:MULTISPECIES: PTS transporter subunit IIC [Enterococcus]EAA0412398.1 PTS galactitol transporter subunit IIC [Listeria monocytogenes]EAC2325864.1 PTS galactitol transporter subunit IIC [Listeria monocytogenes]EAC5497628.1 PTS galactitol transporter subunit IIC [Listeria monocytogenes]EAC5558378.1 PTS galactitol transporter subunit IIC [Listeria monocytogenes]EAC9277162.1 PTS galactitol transporter subunit IIC [Listeria monocytogenes]
MLEILSNIMDSFGAAIVVPVIIFFIALVMKVKPKKAFNAALNAGIGLTGFNMIIGAYSPIVTPVVQRMVAETGVNLRILDTGWQATSVVAYSTQVGMIFLGLGLLMQLILFVLKFTNIFMPSDLWNNYSFMLWGSMLYIATGNLWLSIGLMVLSNLYCFVFSEIVAKRWSTYYGYPSCTITAPHHICSVPLAIGIDWILTKLGANKVQWNPEKIQEKLGFLGEPTSLGLVLGSLLGLAGNFMRLNTLEGWGEIATVGIATAAIMAIFPKIAGIFASAFTTITDASKKTAKSGGKNRVWFLAINDAAGYGETSTLLTGMLLMPIVLILAIILPGNETLPMVDLIAIPYMIELIICISNGNIFKSLISGTIWCIGGLYMITAVAPIFTEVAMEVGVNLPEGALLICSFAVMTNHIMGGLFLIFLTQNPFLIGLSVIVYIGMYFFVRTKREVIHNYLEKQAELESNVQITLNEGAT